MISRELEINTLPIKGSFLIAPKEFRDERGTFLKLYDRNGLKSRNVEPLFVEGYLSISSKGVIRGLHYQLRPWSQSKFVRCVSGAVYDVMVDICRSSNTFGKWHSVLLSADNRQGVYVPNTCAHGFLALDSNSVVSYMTDNDYAPQHERGIIWNDTSLAIPWPQMDRYIVSKKDSAWPTFDEAEKFT